MPLSRRKLLVYASSMPHNSDVNGVAVQVHVNQCSVIANPQF